MRDDRAIHSARCLRARARREHHRARKGYPERPLSPLYEELRDHGIELSPPAYLRFKQKGRLPAGDYAIAADVSSQFIGGLLFALSVVPGTSTLTLTGRIESAPYIDMTLDVLALFGARITRSEDGRRFTVEGLERLRSPGAAEVEGDWSNSAFWLCAGALGRGVTLTGFVQTPTRGSRAVVKLLEAFGAEVSMTEDAVTVRPEHTRRGMTVDAPRSPTSSPVLSVVAAFAEGETRFINAGRLRIKESDRLATTRQLLEDLGADVEKIPTDSSCADARRFGERMRRHERPPHRDVRSRRGCSHLHTRRHQGRTGRSQIVSRLFRRLCPPRRTGLSGGLFMPYFGRNIRTAVFGQSHAAAIGVTIDGLPAGEAVDAVELEAFMARRAPEQNRMTTQRREADRPEILCGIVDGRTCGAPLTSIIRNGDTRSKDYAAIADLPRPSHADWPAHVRYGGWQDVRGGGAFSARLTAPLCIAGGIAMQILARRGIRIAAHVRSVGAAEDRPYDPMGESSETIEESLARSPVALSNEAAAAMAAEIEAARQEADSIGGTVECMISGLPVGLGGPLFEGLDGRIAQAVFAVPAVKGVEFGEGFGAALLRGSENNDPYGMRKGP